MDVMRLRYLVARLAIFTEGVLLQHLDLVVAARQHRGGQKTRHAASDDDCTPMLLHHDLSGIILDGLDNELHLPLTHARMCRKRGDGFKQTRRFRARMRELAERWMKVERLGVISDHLGPDPARGQVLAKIEPGACSRENKIR